jgi:putative nucleotidyltransferase with HDIG domain
MLTEAEAEGLIARHLGTSPRARHSVEVGALMAGLAEAIGADAVLWQVTGLCHDLDYAQTRDTPERHGPLAAAWLAGRLPADACSAIAAHDHRAGFVDTSALAEALRLADALAIARQQHGDAVRAALLQRDVEATFASLFRDRSWLGQMILRGSRALQLDTTSIAALVA